MPSQKLKGNIIRILDTKTVAINLGKAQGINSTSIFHILGEPEKMVDPLTKELLGMVRVTKGKVRASQVFDKFTIASTDWVDKVLTSQIMAGRTINDIFGGIQEVPVSGGELNVRPEDIQPWRARDESPVKVGDEVEVFVDIPPPIPPPSSKASEDSSGQIKVPPPRPPKVNK